MTISREQIASHIDHTELKAFTKWKDVQKLCDEAVKYKAASVCVPPAYVKQIKEAYGDKLPICTVIGFPLGYNTTACKVFETKDAIENGADEVDMVINIGWAKEGRFDLVEQEIKALRQVSQGRILKVIIETCYLNPEEIAQVSKCVTNAGADYIKTSTGFGSDGATIENVRLMKANIGSQVKIKAAGGIRTVADLEAYMAEGCDRMGSSAGLRALYE